MTDNSCEHARELMAEAWMKQLDEISASELRDHLETCAPCAAEMDALGSMWEKLGDLPVPEPGFDLRLRWDQTMRSLTGEPPARTRHLWWRSIWPVHPAWQMAIAGLCLVFGLGAGVYLERSSVEGDEVAKLREEVASTKEMVAVSLLQQQSATERLRGVDYSARMPEMEPQVVDALIHAVDRDSSVNVRLAAIDALGKVANEAQVRASMREALPQQDSPMVQAALIDYMVDAHDRNAVDAIRDLGARPGVNSTVRERATDAMNQLAH